MPTRHVWTAILACALGLAACGGTSGEATPSVAPATASPTTTASPTASPTAPATLRVATVDPFGEVLVDEDGRTLYRFLADTGTQSTCEGDCATTWPPLTVDDGPVAGPGVDPALLATTTRADGTLQVTYAGHPLYRYAGDEQPGQANGQGIGGVWFVVGADGAPVREATQAAGGYGGRYGDGG
jgi:predicted lipoprotein with Yx(FWY)xxD motif